MLTVRHSRSGSAPSKEDTGGWMRKLTRKAGEPLVRLAVRRAMKIIGGEFVVGRSIEEALGRSAREAEVGLCSFDMLGEGARTAADAERYLKSYEHAIAVIGAAAAGRPAHEASSISIKLSALEPRYNLLQQERVMQRLVPKVQSLVSAGGGTRHPADHRRRGSRSAGFVTRHHRSAGAGYRDAQLAGPGAGDSSLRQAGAGCDRLGCRDGSPPWPADDGAPGQGCLLGL